MLSLSKKIYLKCFCYDICKQYYLLFFFFNVEKPRISDNEFVIFFNFYVH